MCFFCIIRYVYRCLRPLMTFSCSMALTFRPPESLWPYVFQCFCVLAVLRPRSALKSLINTKRTCDFFTPNLRFQCMSRNCEKITNFLKVASNHQDHAISMQELRFSPPAFSIPSSFRMPHLLRFHWN